MGLLIRYGKVDTSYWVEPNREDPPDYLWFPIDFLTFDSPFVKLNK